MFVFGHRNQRSIRRTLSALQNKPAAERTPAGLRDNNAGVSKLPHILFLSTQLSSWSPCQRFAWCLGSSVNFSHLVGYDLGLSGACVS